VRLVPFQFSASGELPLSGMSPELSRILTDCSPDIVFTAGAGYPEYPMANITKLPIIHYNIFGSINPQTNIVAHWCISQLLTTRVQELLPKRIVETVYIQSEGPDARAVQRGQELRHSLGIPDGDIVFGRIGRPDDNIFDPIGIEAFRRVAVLHPNAHYLIVTPPPCLRKLLQEHPVPRVHLLPEQVSNEMSWSGVEEKVWAFHAAADVLAHFRLDGETMGLNIAESMLSGKPVITHVSRFWNAHLEYLDATCAFVAEQDNVTQYADYMTRFLKPDGSALLQSMGKASLAKAQPLFLVQNNIESISNRIEATLLKTQNSL
jgi:glycosyltransferase involved in cell wall biosynthesis